METAAIPPLAPQPLALWATPATAGAGPPAPDSVLALDDTAGGFDAPGAPPVVSYPPYTTAQLQDFVRRTAAALGGSAQASLASVSEPGLYALTAALFSLARRHPAPTAGRSGLPGNGLPDAGLNDTGLVSELRQELRWRNCRAMGRDPAGAVRRGRLLQLVGSFTTLSRSGASPLQRHRVSGDCPFCGGAATLCVFLAGVRWRCFGCHRQGGLPEFAAAMLDAIDPET